MHRSFVIPCVAGFGEILNSQHFPEILPKVLAKLSSIFRFLSELFPWPPKKWVEKLHILCSLIFLFLSKFWNHNFGQIFEYCCKIRKDSIFRAAIFAKLSLKYWRNIRCRHTSYIPSLHVSLHAASTNRIFQQNAQAVFPI